MKLEHDQGLDSLASSRIGDMIATGNIKSIHLDISTAHSHLRHIITAERHWTILIDAFSVAQLRLIQTIQLAATARPEVLLQPSGAECVMLVLRKDLPERREAASSPEASCRGDD